MEWEKDGTGFTSTRGSSRNRDVGRHPDTPARGAAEQLALLEELKTLAAHLGFEVRQEKLLREVGYRVRSGSCRVREAHVILLDRALLPNAQIDILVEELAGRSVDDVYLSPAARRLLERAVPAAAAPERPTP